MLNEMSLQASRPCGQFLNPRVCLILYPFYFYLFAVIITMHRRGIYLGLEVKKNNRNDKNHLMCSFKSLIRAYAMVG